MIRVLTVLLCGVLALALPAWGQSVFDVLPSTPSGNFSTQVTLPDSSLWRTTGLQLAPDTTLTFPDLSTWASAGPAFAASSTLRLPDASTWTRALLQYSATATIRGPDSSTWNSTGLSVASGKQLYLDNGSSAAPALSFGSQATAGLYREAADDLRLVLSGSIPALRAYKANATTGLVSVPLGASTGAAVLGGRLCTSTTSAPTTGTTAQTLATCVLPANALSVNGAGVKVKAWGTTAANANNKTFAIYLGATACSSLTSATNNGNLAVEATIIRTGAATQECGGTAMSSNGGVNVIRATPAEDTTAAITLDIVSTTPTAAGDFTFRGLLVEIFN